eukprot:m.483406 g.483406  ORF g.483406 m.483406 type:complete len:567 (+) comp21727_c0_seq2:100-1800(+)
MMLFTGFVFLFCGCIVQSKYISKWSILGPFPRAKTEYDADPIEAFGGISTLHPGSKSEKFLSEQGVDGTVGWGEFRASPTNGMVSVSFQNINWNRYISDMGDLAVANFQAWVHGRFKVQHDGIYVISCTNVHNFEVVSSPIDPEANRSVQYMGDIYGAGVNGAVRYFKKGTFAVRFILAAKAQAQFRCDVSPASDGHRLMPQSAKLGVVFDVVNGRMFSNVVSFQIANADTRWHTVEYKAIKAKATARDITVTSDVVREAIAPGQTRALTLNVTLESSRKDKLLSPVDAEVEKCHTFVITAKWTSVPAGHTRSHRNAHVPVTVRCRKARQSFRFTFLDHDGTGAEAAAIAPNAPCVAAGCPVVLTHSGVGATPSSQADAYKHKATTTDAEYTFGFDAAWVLAPERGGAHNWEGQGHLSALASLEALRQLASRFDPTRGAEVGRVVVAGHSRGGHGAALFATHFPGRVPHHARPPCSLPLPRHPRVLAPPFCASPVLPRSSVDLAAVASPCRAVFPYDTMHCSVTMATHSSLALTWGWGCRSHARAGHVVGLVRPRILWRRKPRLYS